MLLRSRALWVLVPCLAAALVGCSPFAGYHAGRGDAAVLDEGGKDAGPRDDASKNDGKDVDAAADGGKPEADAAAPMPRDCNTRGKGTSAQPCLVHDCAELQAVAAQPTGVYALANDI